MNKVNRGRQRQGRRSCQGNSAHLHGAAGRVPSGAGGVWKMLEAQHLMMAAAELKGNDGKLRGRGDRDSFGDPMREEG